MSIKTRINKITHALDAVTPNRDAVKKLHDQRIANMKIGLSRFLGNKTERDIDAIVPTEVERWEIEVEERRRKWGVSMT